MVAVQTFEHDDYLPEYGLIVLRDPDDTPEPVTPPHGEDEDEEPTGTFAGAGLGWLLCQAGSDHHVVRLELHDTAPAADHTDYDEALETPYAARSGGLSLTCLTGGAGDADLDLGGVGWFRARVARRRGDTPDGVGDRWLLRFWPDPSPAPPVWLTRSRPAVGVGDNGWRSVLGFEPTELADVVNAVERERGGPVTAEDLDAWFRAHSRPDGWLDALMWQPPRPPLTTGHADLDSRREAQHAEVAARLAGSQRGMDAIAAELGAPPVRRRRDLLPLLAVAGILNRVGGESYRVGTPARVDTVLSLSPQRARAVRLQDARSRYGALAEDVRSVLRWAPELPLEITADELAGRLLVTPQELREALAFAEATKMLHADGEEALRLRLGPRPEPALPASSASKPAPPPAPRGPAPHTAAPMLAGPAPAPSPRPAALPGDETPATVFQGVSGRLTYNSTAGSGRGRKEPPAPPFGAPPRAGVIESDGTVVEWRDGERTELGRLDSRRRWAGAFATACGVLVFGHDGPAQLVAGGEVTELGDVRAMGLVIMGDGRRVVTVSSEHHRTTSRYRLRIIDLAGGPEQTMPWPENRTIMLLGAHRDTVFFREHHAYDTTMRWTPGADPEPHPQRFDMMDPLSGTTCHRTMQGMAVTRPGEATVTVPVDTMARLVPGGDKLWTVRSDPAALTVFPVEPGPEVRPQVWWLPETGHRSPRGAYGAPMWEDPGHALFAYQHWHFPRDPASGVRLSIRDGTVERLPATDRRPLMFIQPLLIP